MATTPREPVDSASSTPPPGGDLIGDLFALVGLPNPLAGVITTMDQMRRGSEDFLVAVETFTRTMENVNETASRMNRLLDDVEAPIRAVAPAMSRLADTLGSPTITNLPTDLNDVVKALGELARRLAPLGQLAESAGGMFGLRSLFPGGPRTVDPIAEPIAERAPAQKSAAQKAPARKTTAKKAPTRKATAKKAPAKKPAAKKG